MKRAKKSLSVILMTLALVICFAGFKTVNAQAATKTLKKIKYSPTLTNAISSKATLIKKGTTKLNTKGSGYAKFVVPATKKYTFTFSGLRSGNGSYNVGHGYIMLPETYTYSSTVSLADQTFKTTGGSVSTAYFASKSSTASDKKYASLAVRPCSLVLQKGQTVYIYISCVNSGSINLKIK